MSHDRAFLDNVVTQTIAYEGDGHWLEYAGGYSDWQRVKAGTVKQAATDAKEAAAKTAGAARKPKLSYKEARELEALPAKLEALEAEQAALNARLADPATYNDRSVDVKALNTRHDAIEAELTALLARWEALEAKP